MAQPKVFLLNEPTRGVDIASKPKLLATVREDLAAESGVVMISESEDELIEVCDRILVFYRGRLARVFERSSPEFTVGNVYRAIQGVET